MKLEPKITVKHYLNTRLKPTIINGLNYYSVYVSLTYNRNNCRFKSIIKDVFFDIKTMQIEAFSDIKIEKESLIENLKKTLFINPNFTNLKPLYKNSLIESKILKLENEILKLKKQIEL